MKSILEYITKLFTYFIEKKEPLNTYKPSGHLMLEFVFFIQGSEEYPYCVTFRKTDEKIIILCTCKAFEKESFCKHRIRVLRGSDESMVEGNKDELKRIPDLIKNTRFEELLDDMDYHIKTIDKMESNLKTIKRELSQLMLGLNKKAS